MGFFVKEGLVDFVTQEELVSFILQDTPVGFVIKEGRRMDSWVLVHRKTRNLACFRVHSSNQYPLIVRKIDLLKMLREFQTRKYNCIALFQSEEKSIPLMPSRGHEQFNAYYLLQFTTDF